MAEDRASDPVPFDLGRIKELIQLMVEHDLTEVDLHKGDERCRLRRGPQGVVPMLSSPYPAAFPPSAHAAGGGTAAPATSGPVADGTVVIKSPTVGTFYAAASPEDEPFAKVGTAVESDTVVCLVEAMKVYNQITADVKGTITEVLVSNGDAIEFGQPLFRVRPS